MAPPRSPARTPPTSFPSPLGLLHAFVTHTAVGREVCGAITNELSAKMLLRGISKRLGGSSSTSGSPLGVPTSVTAGGGMDSSGADPLELFFTPAWTPSGTSPSFSSTASASASVSVMVPVERYKRAAAGKVLHASDLRTVPTLEKSMHFLVEHFLRDPGRQHQPTLYTAAAAAALVPRLSSASSSSASLVEVLVPLYTQHALLWREPDKLWGYLWDRFRGIRASWIPQLPPVGDYMPPAQDDGSLDWCAPPLSEGHSHGVELPAVRFITYQDDDTKATISADTLRRENSRRMRWLEFMVAALYFGAASLCRSVEGCQSFLMQKKNVLESISQCFTDLAVWYRTQKGRYRHAELFSVLLLIYGFKQEMKVEDRSFFCEFDTIHLQSSAGGREETVSEVYSAEPPSKSLNLSQVYRELARQPHLIRTRPVRAVLRLLHCWANRSYFEFLALCREGGIPRKSAEGKRNRRPKHHTHAAPQKEDEEDEVEASTTANGSDGAWDGPSSSSSSSFYLTPLQRAVLFQSFTYARFRAVLDVLQPNYVVYQRLRLREYIPICTLSYLLLMEEAHCLRFLEVFGVSHLIDERVDVPVSCLLPPPASSLSCASTVPGPVLVLRLSNEKQEPLVSSAELMEKCANKAGLFLPTYTSYFGFTLWHTALASSPSEGATLATKGEETKDHHHETSAVRWAAEEEGALLRLNQYPIDWMALLEPYCPPYTAALAQYPLEDVDESTWFAAIPTHREAALQRYRGAHRHAPPLRRSAAVSGATPLPQDTACGEWDAESLSTRDSVFDSWSFSSAEAEEAAKEEDGGAEDEASCPVERVAEAPPIPEWDPTTDSPVETMEVPQRCQAIQHWLHTLHRDAVYGQAALSSSSSNSEADGAPSPPFSAPLPASSLSLLPLPIPPTTAIAPSHPAPTPPVHAGPFPAPDTGSGVRPCVTPPPPLADSSTPLASRRTPSPLPPVTVVEAEVHSTPLDVSPPPSPSPSTAASMFASSFVLPLPPPPILRPSAIVEPSTPEVEAATRSFALATTHEGVSSNASVDSIEDVTPEVVVVVPNPKTPPPPPPPPMAFPPPLPASTAAAKGILPPFASLSSVTAAPPFRDDRPAAPALSLPTTRRETSRADEPHGDAPPPPLPPSPPPSVVDTTSCEEETEEEEEEEGPPPPPAIAPEWRTAASLRALRGSIQFHLHHLVQTDPNDPLIPERQRTTTMAKADETISTYQQLRHATCEASHDAPPPWETTTTAAPVPMALHEEASSFFHKLHVTLASLAAPHLLYEEESTSSQMAMQRSGAAFPPPPSGGTGETASAGRLLPFRWSATCGASPRTVELPCHLMLWRPHCEEGQEREAFGATAFAPPSHPEGAEKEGTRKRSREGPPLERVGASHGVYERLHTLLFPPRPDALLAHSDEEEEDDDHVTTTNGRERPSPLYREEAEEMVRYDETIAFPTPFLASSLVPSPTLFHCSTTVRVVHAAHENVFSPPSSSSWDLSSSLPASSASSQWGGCIGLAVLPDISLRFSSKRVTRPKMEGVALEKTSAGVQDADGEVPVEREEDGAGHEAWKHCEALLYAAACTVLHHEYGFYSSSSSSFPLLSAPLTGMLVLSTTPSSTEASCSAFSSRQGSILNDRPSPIQQRLEEAWWRIFVPLAKRAQSAVKAVTTSDGGNAFPHGDGGIPTAEGRAPQGEAAVETAVRSGAEPTTERPCGTSGSPPPPLPSSSAFLSTTVDPTPWSLSQRRAAVLSLPYAATQGHRWAERQEGHRPWSAVPRYRPAGMSAFSSLSHPTEREHKTPRAPPHRSIPQDSHTANRSDRVWGKEEGGKPFFGPCRYASVYSSLEDDQEKEEEEWWGRVADRFAPVMQVEYISADCFSSVVSTSWTEQRCMNEVSTAVQRGMKNLLQVH